MIIELTEVGKWIAHCDKVIERVNTVRAREDAEYEQRWRIRKWPFKNRPDTCIPDKEDHWNPFYPSVSGFGSLRVAKMLKDVLEDNRTGVVAITDREYALLN